MNKDTGSLESRENKKAEIWANHFQHLAKDTTGNSRNPEKWKELLPSNDYRLLEGCDDAMNWGDVRSALKAMRRNKASGQDGIPSEVLKVAEDEKKHTSHFTKILFSLVKHMWDKGKTPDVWNSAVVVLIPKKSDLRQVDNYRGISLISTTVKLVMTVVNQRLNVLINREGLLRKNQAGFRSREECIAQATTLYEIAIRRRNFGMNTLACFLDFAKAYERVPHEELLKKLRSVEIGGKLLRMIRAAYENSRICVRSGPILSKEVPYHRGVRQGCPS